MRVLRANKDSVMAVLEAFVYDPLLNWRLIDGRGSCDGHVTSLGGHVTGCARVVMLLFSGRFFIVPLSTVM